VGRSYNILQAFFFFKSSSYSVLQTDFHLSVWRRYTGQH